MYRKYKCRGRMDARERSEKDTGASQHSSRRELPDTPCGLNPAYAEHQDWGG